MPTILLTERTQTQNMVVRHYQVVGHDNSWVRFSSDQSEWLGVFGNGMVSPYSAAVTFDTAEGPTALVIARGQGYVIDIKTRDLLRLTDWNLVYSCVSVPQRPYAVVANTTQVWTVGRARDQRVLPARSSRFALPRVGPNRDQVAFDGIVFTEATHDELSGHLAEPEGWYKFRITLDELRLHKQELVSEDPEAFQGEPPFGGFPPSSELSAQMEQYRLS